MSSKTTNGSQQHSLREYAFISDCHGAALISRDGSIDWCCMPRFDSPACFSALLDPTGGGRCALTAADRGAKITRRYRPGSLVLETRIVTETGEVQVLDLFAMRTGGRRWPHRQILRVVEGLAGRVTMLLDLCARFDFGDQRPWVRRHGEHLFSVIGGSSALIVEGDVPLRPQDERLVGELTIEPGQRRRLSIRFERPEDLHPHEPSGLSLEELDARVEETCAWWQRWSGRLHVDGLDLRVMSSAPVVKGLTYAPTGAIVAAPTCSLPEALGGERNWDYRYVWLRDAAFALHSLAKIGEVPEARHFRDFVERTSAGNAEDLLVCYGVGGERLLFESELPWVRGYRGCRPVRVGNAAQRQLQLDVFGDLLLLAWAWHQRGHSPEPRYWAFLVDVVERVCALWRMPDRGIWEERHRALHFVYAKAMCWAALDRGIRLAEALGLPAPIQRWRAVRADVRRAVEQEGVEPTRGCFRRAFDTSEVDASLLLVPRTGFVPYDDPRMVRTVDAIRADLEEGGFVRRYRSDDGFVGEEGAFVCCTFWLAECLAHQGRRVEARAVYDRAMEAANDVGLFSEVFVPGPAMMLGNMPQGLSHYAHIDAAVALAGE